MRSFFMSAMSSSAATVNKLFYVGAVIADILFAAAEGRAAAAMVAAKMVI